MKTAFVILRICWLTLFSASALIAQEGRQTGPPKPNGPVNKSPLPNKAPPGAGQFPDLIVRSANLIEPGSTKVSIRIANIGKADADNFQVSYVCDWYPKEAGKPSIIAGAVIAVESLAAGESKPFEVDCQRNSSIGTKLKFGAMADWEKKIKESNETNNSYPASYLK